MAAPHSVIAGRWAPRGRRSRSAAAAAGRPARSPRCRAGRPARCGSPGRPPSCGDDPRRERDAGLAGAAGRGTAACGRRTGTTGRHREVQVRPRRVAPVQRDGQRPALQTAGSPGPLQRSRSSRTTGRPCCGCGRRPLARRGCRRSPPDAVQPATSSTGSLTAAATHCDRGAPAHHGAVSAHGRLDRGDAQFDRDVLADGGLAGSSRSRTAAYSAASRLPTAMTSSSRGSRRRPPAPRRPGSTAAAARR